MFPEILPADRTWPEPTERLAQALLDAAAIDIERAALYILFRDPELTFTRDDFIRAYTVDGTVAWYAWALDLRSRKFAMTGNDQSRAMLELACSLGDTHVRIRLVHTLAELVPANQQIVLDALQHLAGVR